MVLDDCNFHESVQLDSFDIDRKLTLVSSKDAYLKKIEENSIFFVLSVIVNFLLVSWSHIHLSLKNSFFLMAFFLSLSSLT